MRDGVGHLTLEAVAAEAGLSKGGVLYNYPNKDALIRGMVERLIEQTEAEIARIAENDPEPKGRHLRAYLAVTFPGPNVLPERVNRVCAVLLTAILTNSSLLDPVREYFGAMQKRLLAEGLDERMVHIIRLAADGLWLSEMLQMPGPEGESRQSVITQLNKLTHR